MTVGPHDELVAIVATNLRDSDTRAHVEDVFGLFSTSNPAIKLGQNQRDAKPDG